MIPTDLICILIICSFIIYQDRNLFAAAYLYLTLYPRMWWQKAFLWLKLWPQLQRDRWYLTNRNRRVAKTPDRFVRMAEQLTKEINDAAGRTEQPQDGD
jgi:hypothetical protein